jgi:hypothetical protein
MIAVKNFPFLAPKLESLDKKSEKICLMEFSGVPAYIPILNKTAHSKCLVWGCKPKPPKILSSHWARVLQVKID